MTTRSKKPQQAPVQTPPEPAGAEPTGLEPYGPIVLKLSPALELTDEQLLEICSLNDDIRIERNSEGELELMAPAGGTTGRINGRITVRLGTWAENEGSGEYFDSSAGFTLPGGAVRSPDAAWILKERWEALPDEDRDRFAHICPDFVVEIRSKSDRLSSVQAKMEEYIANGARLGWLIDPVDPRHRVYIYRPNTGVEILEEPETVSGDPELPGFVLDLKPVWAPSS